MKYFSVKFLEVIIVVFSRRANRLTYLKQWRYEQIIHPLNACLLLTQIGYHAISCPIEYMDLVYKE